VDKSTPSIS